MSRHAIGIDFGTESARAFLVDVESGTVPLSASCVYPHGVLDRWLPSRERRLPPDWALQPPGDWAARDRGVAACRGCWRTL